jgi:hypothetical protein
MDWTFALRLHYFTHLRQYSSVALVLTHLYKLAAVSISSLQGVFVMRNYFLLHV